MIDTTTTDGAAVLTWDMPGRKQNVLSADSLAAFDAAITAAL